VPGGHGRLCLFEKTRRRSDRWKRCGAFIDGRFKYYGIDATIKARVRALEEKREAEHAIKEEERRKRKLHWMRGETKSCGKAWETL
jgi:hypothetical protein